MIIMMIKTGEKAVQPADSSESVEAHSTDSAFSVNPRFDVGEKTTEGVLPELETHYRAMVRKQNCVVLPTKRLYKYRYSERQ